jgi:hypothetical protein
MLLMLLIGWTILLPAVVVGGLYVGSAMLGRGLLPAGRFSEAALEMDFYEMTPVAITGPAVPAVSAAAARSAEPSPAASERRPVSAGY